MSDFFLTKKRTQKGLGSHAHERTVKDWSYRKVKKVKLQNEVFANYNTFYNGNKKSRGCQEATCSYWKDFEGKGRTDDVGPLRLHPGLVGIPNPNLATQPCSTPTECEQRPENFFSEKQALSQSSLVSAFNSMIGFKAITVDMMREQATLMMPKWSQNSDGAWAVGMESGRLILQHLLQRSFKAIYYSACCSRWHCNR